MKKHLSGFTLIEILVALLILAIVGAMMVVGLESSVRSQNRIRQDAALLANVQSAVIIMERDIAQIINRPVIDVNGAQLPAIMVRYPGDNLNLEFTHAGFVNPFGMANRTTMQRTSYTLNNNQLLRTTWQELDRTPNTTTKTETLLENVNSFSVRFMDINHQMLIPSETAIQQPMPYLPLAIEINLDVNGIGNITRLIPLPG